MAEYVCRLGTPTGEIVTRTIEATAERDLRSKLEREGFRVFSVAASGSAGLRRSLGGESRGQKVKKSLTYPAVLFSASMLLVMVLSTYVIPQFMKLYSGQEQNLPTITVAVVAIADFISGNLTWLIPTVIGTLIFLFVWRRTPNGRLMIDRWTLKLPLAGE